jgi:hypothetical protein
MAKTLVALYDTFDDAQTSVQDLMEGGFRRDDISVVAADEHGQYEPLAGTGGAGGLGEGAGLGAVLGGVAGLLVGLGALAIPGIGPVLAAGPLAATLTGAGIGAVTGGLIGALVDVGIPEEEARSYAEGVRHGGTLVTVRSSDQLVDRAKDILNRRHPVDIHQRANQWQDTDSMVSQQMPSGALSQPPAATAPAVQSARTYATYDSDFRRNYEKAYAHAGYSFDQFEPAYRYGFDEGTVGDYSSGDWEDIEARIRRSWEQRHPGSKWQDVRAAVRYGWERGAGRIGADAWPSTENYPDADQDPGHQWDPGGHRQV